MEKTPAQKTTRLTLTSVSTRGYLCYYSAIVSYADERAVASIAIATFGIYLPRSISILIETSLLGVG